MVAICCRHSNQLAQHHSHPLRACFASVVLCLQNRQLQNHLRACKRLKFPGATTDVGKGNGNPLQYSCLENPMDGGSWQAPRGRKESDPTEQLHFHFHYRCTESEILKVGLSCPCFNNPSRASVTLRHSKIWEPLQDPSATQSFICVSLSSTWEFIRNVESWAPTQTDRIRSYKFAKLPDYSHEVGEAKLCVCGSLLTAHCNCLWCVFIKKHIKSQRF